MSKIQLMTKLTSIFLTALFLGSWCAQAQITHVDANASNTQAVGGTPSPFSTTSTTSDNLWKFRPDFGFDVAGNNGIYEKDGSSGGYGDAAKLETIIASLTPNTEYAVYINFLSASNATWSLQAGVTENSLSLFTPSTTSVENLGLTSVSGSNRNQLRGFIANATSDASGNIKLYIDDTSATNNSNRAWFDGVSYGPSVTPPDPPVLEQGLVVSDGAWTWFNDERAIWHDDKLYVGYVKKNGKISVTQYNPDTETGAETELSTLSQVDDHNNPALHVLPDGKILASYSRHNPDNFFSYRISNSTSPQTISDWGSESTHGSSKHSYSNTYAMSAESDKIYSFTRAGSGWNPNWTVSSDDGATWSTMQELIKNGDSNTRPYLRYSGNGVDAVDFIYTDGHPRNENNSIYHARIQGGNVLHTDGSTIKALSATPLVHDAASPERGTIVYQYSAATQSDPNEWIPSGRAWSWDIQQQKNGDPVIAFTVQKDDVTGSGWNHDRIYYYYARWTGSAWQKRFIAHAGRPLYDHEDDYAGGICIDPERPNVVYISSSASNPFDLTSTTNVPLNTGSRYELWKGTTNDGGLSFSWEAVTSGSTEDNIRPFVPKHHDRAESLLWLKGTYTAYQNYNTRVMSKIGAAQTGYQAWKTSQGYSGGPSDDDNGDGVANVIEYHRHVSGNAADAPLLTPVGDVLHLPSPPASPDMRVELQTSVDLFTWDVVATSVYGSAFAFQTTGFSLGTSGEGITVIPDTALPHRFYRLWLTL